MKSTMLALLALGVALLHGAAAWDGDTRLIQLNAHLPAEHNVTSEEEKKIEGRIRINGALYKTVCDCSPEAVAAMRKAGADPTKSRCRIPTKFRIFREHEPSPPAGFNAPQLREFLGRPSDLEFVNVKEQYFADVDGRVDGAVLSTLGGDAGEFLLAMQMYEDALGKKGDEHDVARYLHAWLNETAPRPFYFHSTKTAVDNLKEELNADIDLLEPVSNEMQKYLLGSAGCDLPPCALMDADNVGVTHLEQMLRRPERYHVSPSLVREFIRAFYSLLWDRGNPLKSRLMFTILPKRHHESAFVSIRVSAGCNDEARAPLIQPHDSTGKSVFVYQVDAVDARRAELARFFSRMDPSHHVREADLLRRIRSHAKGMLEETAEHQAAHLPIYTVTLM